MASALGLSAARLQPFGLLGFVVSGNRTHGPLSSSFLGLPYRILNINHKEELLRGLWVNPKP